jgi:hypothetical protein
LILDDYAITYIRNYGNAIPIRTFNIFDKDCDKDDHLLVLPRFLEKLLSISETTGTIRNIEKRYWYENHKQ